MVTISAKKGAKGGTGSGSIIRSGRLHPYQQPCGRLAADGGSVSVLFNNGKTADATIVGRDPDRRGRDQSERPEQAVGDAPWLFEQRGRRPDRRSPRGAPWAFEHGYERIVSALDRTISVPGEGSQSALPRRRSPTDASIKPDNSGGPRQLLRPVHRDAFRRRQRADRVRRIGAGGASGSTSPSPSTSPSAEANEIISTGHVTHAYFGLTAVPLSPDASLVHGVAEGLLVTGIDPGGPSQAAGLRVGDIITTLDGQSVVSTDELMSLTLSKKPGDTVKVGYVRDGKSATTTVTLGTQPT